MNDPNDPLNGATWKGCAAGIVGLILGVLAGIGIYAVLNSLFGMDDDGSSLALFMFGGFIAAMLIMMKLERY